MTAATYCPHCGADAVDITTTAHRGPRKFMCTGKPWHEFLEGDAPEPEPDEPDIVEEIASRVVERMQDRPKQERPSLMKRLTRLF